MHTRAFFAAVEGGRVCTKLAVHLPGVSAVEDTACFFIIHFSPTLSPATSLVLKEARSTNKIYGEHALRRVFSLTFDTPGWSGKS